MRDKNGKLVYSSQLPDLATFERHPTDSRGFENLWMIRGVGRK